MSVRLLVAAPGGPPIHARFADLPCHLAPGDLLVVNESATIPAAVPAVREDGSRVQVHFSTPAPTGVSFPCVCREEWGDRPSVPGERGRRARPSVPSSVIRAPPGSARRTPARPS